MVNKLSDNQLANEYRRLRMQMRPLFNELTRRVTEFENIIITKPTVTRL